MFSHKFITLLIILAVIVTTVISYANGMTGGYLLDDIPNLKNITVFSRFEGLDALIRYVISYESGLLKRPISTLSFLLNSTTLTVNAFNFKLTNLIIHIINGLLLYLVSFKLLTVQNYKSKDIQVIAISSMALWLLHPYFVSTTLYVVQRMAMLPVTFVLMGMYFYLKARSLPIQKAKLATVYIIIAVYISTLLAVLSKENGIILPVLIILVEYIIVKNSISTQLNKVQKSLIIMPSLIIVVAFMIKMPDFIQGFEYRNFSMIERILTESRVIMDYIGHLFYPRFISPGVFSDGFTISSSLTSPVTTLMSILAIISLLIISFIFRKKQPLISFAVFFYFTGHIIESTFIPLEIYFEHRNYLPALFLFLPIPLLLMKYLNKYNLPIFILVLVSLYLAHITYKKSVLWGDTTNLMLHAAKNNPQSIRAIDEKTTYHFRNNNTLLAIKLLEDSIKIHPETSLRINLLNLKCYTNVATNLDFDILNNYIEKNSYIKDDASSIAGLLNILTYDTCLENNHDLAVKLISTIKNKSNIIIPNIHKVILSAEICLAIEMTELNRIDEKINNYLYQYNDFYDVIMMINKLIDLNESALATLILNDLETKLLLKKHKYTDRDYLDIIKVFKNKLNK